MTRRLSDGDEISKEKDSLKILQKDPEPHHNMANKPEGAVTLTQSLKDTGDIEKLTITGNNHYTLSNQRAKMCTFPRTISFRDSTVLRSSKMEDSGILFLF